MAVIKVMISQAKPVSIALLQRSIIKLKVMLHRGQRAHSITHLSIESLKRCTRYRVATEPRHSSQCKDNKNGLPHQCGWNIGRAGKNKIWTLTPVTINSKPEFILASSAYYPSNSLYVNVTKDEENRQVREYTDKLGKVI